MLQPPGPVDVLDRFAPLYDALHELLAQLTPAQWARPTACAGWTVKDVALHLLGGDLGNLSRRRDGHLAPSDPIESDAQLVAFINAFNTAWVDAARRLSTRILCDLLRFTGPQITAYFAGLDLSARGDPVNWAGPDEAPVWLDVAREYTERWHHQQQIREAVEAPAITTPFFLAPVLATFVHALPVAYRTVEASAGTTVVFAITGAAGGVWSLQRHAHGWQLLAGQSLHAGSTLEVPEDVAWRIFTRGLSAEAARSLVSIDGNQELGRHALSALAIIA